MRSSRLWQDWFDKHGAKDGLNDLAESIQETFRNEAEPENKFCHLTENKNLVLMTRSPHSDEVQFTYYHSLRGSQLLGKQFFGLMKVGVRETAVRMDPDTLFKTSTVERYVPLFDALLRCSSKDDIVNLLPPDKTRCKK